MKGGHAKVPWFKGHGHCAAVASKDFAQNSDLEDDMAISRKETRGSRAFAFPVFGIIVLLACYWVLAEWQQMPTIINDALASMHWPT
jgi:hypothetical protein